MGSVLNNMTNAIEDCERKAILNGIGEKNMDVRRLCRQWERGETTLSAFRRIAAADKTSNGDPFQFEDLSLPLQWCAIDVFNDSISDSTQKRIETAADAATFIAEYPFEEGSG